MADLIFEQMNGQRVDVDLVRKLAPPVRFKDVEICVHCKRYGSRWIEPPVYGTHHGLRAEICRQCFEWMSCGTDEDPKEGIS